MNTYIKHKRSSFAYRVFSVFIAFTFVFSSIILPQRAYSQSVLNLPAPGSMVALSPTFNPPIIKGITIHPENPLLFDFIVYPGDDNLKDQELRKESTKLIKYFMASLTVPEDQMWVNLSPYEEDRIVPTSLGQTEMGRDLLAQDYLLKQLTASLMYPEDELGSEFWKRVYKKANEKYGTSEIPMNTFNKIWIMPETASIYENGTSVFVVDSHLKVMLEEDYLALEVNAGRDDHGIGAHNGTSIQTGIESEIIREILIPEIEREVNTGKSFTNLRQIYNSVILATWYKQNLKESLLGQVYVDQNKTKGIDIEDQQINEKIYNQYLEAFKVGVYDYIKEDYDSRTQEIIPRKYFSGGVAISSPILNVDADPGIFLDEVRRVRVGFDAISDVLMIASSPAQEDPDLASSQLASAENLRSALKKWFWGGGDVTTEEADKLIDQLREAGVKKIGEQIISFPPLIYNIKHDHLENVVVKVRHPDREVLHQDIVDFVEAISKSPHPNVQTAYQYGAVDERFIWFTQQWVVGETLKEYLARNNNFMGVEDIRTIMQDLQSGMTHVRNLGFLYLDVKDENIIVRRDATGRLGLTLIDMEAVKRYSEDGIMQVRFAGLLETILDARDTRLIEYVIDSKSAFVSYAKSMKEKYQVSDEEGLVDVLARLFRKAYAIRGASGEVQYDSMFDVFNDIHNILNLISNSPDAPKQEAAQHKDSAQLTTKPTAAPGDTDLSDDVSSPIAAITDTDVGGIDLNPQVIEMDKRGVRVDFQLPTIDPQQIQNINIEGFLPIIISISPIMNIPFLLGISDTEEKPMDLGFESLDPLEKRDRFKVDDPEQLSFLN